MSFSRFLYCRATLCPGSMSSPHLFACPRPQVHISHLDPASLSWVGHHVGSTTGGVCLHLDSEERAPRASPVMQNRCKKESVVRTYPKSDIPTTHDVRIAYAINATLRSRDLAKNR